MSRWIDADALTKRVEESNKSAGLHLEDLRKIRRWIKNAPSINIVRCKECKHWVPTYESIRRCAEMGGMPTNTDDFCSYGEREGE